MNRLDRKIAGLALLSAVPLAPGAANAADLYRSAPPPPAYSAPAPYFAPNSWAGFYVGINGGYGWNNSNNTIGYNGNLVDSSAHAAPQGGFGGGQIGYNFQSGSFVYGVETDFQGGDISNRIAGMTAGGLDFNSRESVNWFGTARGRVGYSVGNALLYGTGGFAYGGVNQHAFVTDGMNSTSLTSNSVQTGWVAGGGVEYKINPAWSLKGEYQYIDLGSQKLNDPVAGVTTNSLDTNMHTVRLGLNYRFGGGSEPLK